MLAELTTILTANILILGIMGLFAWKKNLIYIIISIEIIFLSANLGFILASIQIDDVVGYVYAMFILALAGIEVSIGLALIILVYRKFTNIKVQSTMRIKN
jgi:NADH-quinone oxidoreductase subunit K